MTELNQLIRLSATDLQLAYSDKSPVLSFALLVNVHCTMRYATKSTGRSVIHVGDLSLKVHAQREHFFASHVLKIHEPAKGD